MKFKCYGEKMNKSSHYDKGFGSYIVYYKGISYDVFGVYSPKAAIRKLRKFLKETNEKI